MESTDENGYDEQRTSSKLVCHLIEIRHAPEKLYCSRENKTGQNRKEDRIKGGLCGTIRKKQESTSLPLIKNNIGSGMSKLATKRGVSNTTRIPRESSAHMSVTTGAMTWANNGEIINRALEAFATRNTESGNKGGGKKKKTF